ncbi:MAG: hypothetical protein EOO22_08490 [Comamonadaceae bacterium]|nr:MAG: hypothetical protein EOO22_08490 [Comamonadaceae bacterium]
MTQSDRTSNSNKAEKAMKQFSRTDAEAGRRDDGDDAPAEPNDGAVTRTHAVSPGDAPIGESASDGSSPYEQPNHLAKRQRSD